MKKQKDIHKIYEEEMENEYQFHKIPHHTWKGEFGIDWYPYAIGEGKNKHVEYFLTVSGGGKQLKGSFEQWKKGKGLESLKRKKERLLTNH